MLLSKLGSLSHMSPSVDLPAKIQLQQGTDSVRDNGPLTLPKQTDPRPNPEAQVKLPEPRFLTRLPGIRITSTA